MTLSRDLAVSHLKLRLQGFHRVLRAAVLAQIDRAARLVRADLTPLCITEDEALHLLDDAGRFVLDTSPGGSQLTDAAPDTEAELALRARAQDAGVVLPLDRLALQFDLTDFEQFAVLACAAPELDRSYERIYAFILDELSRGTACVELVSVLASPSIDGRIAFRHALARFGKLRRCGILVARGDAGELRRELRVADGLIGYLTGDGSDLACLCRDTMTAPGENIPADPRVARFAGAMSAGALRIVGIWGPQQSAKEEFAHALGAALGARLRHWTMPADGILVSLRDAAQEAIAGDGLLWIVADDFTQAARREVARMLADELARTSVRVMITGAQPWRPAALLASGAYAEIELAALNLVSRRDMWGEEMPELGAAEATEMATRLRLARHEVRAAVRMARAEQRLAPALRATPFKRVQHATSALAGSRSREFATLIRPKRGPDDLILPQSVHRQVLEIAQFFRAWPTVAETWGFGRLATGEGGIKALFTGESGTGKTLAAEVIAGELRMPLLRIDLSRVVSKWVGETEKNLEAAFAEAEDGQAVLLFDEADALFGKRGEVQSRRRSLRQPRGELPAAAARRSRRAGAAREQPEGQHRQRFHPPLSVVLHFPRPERPERLRHLADGVSARGAGRSVDRFRSLGEPRHDRRRHRRRGAYRGPVRRRRGHRRDRQVACRARDRAAIPPRGAAAHAGRAWPLRQPAAGGAISPAPAKAVEPAPRPGLTPHPAPPPRAIAAAPRPPEQRSAAVAGPGMGNAAVAAMARSVSAAPAAGVSALSPLLLPHRHPSA